MRPQILAATTLALTVVMTGCGDPAAPASVSSVPPGPQFITYGLPDPANSYANVGKFVVQRPNNGPIGRGCSGTLIAPTVFVTAAHCAVIFETQLAPAGFTASVSFDNVIPFYGLTDLNATHLIPVTAIVTHPDFDLHRVGSPGDIAVLILPLGSTGGVTPATLPTLGLLADLAARNGLRDAVFTVVGYGLQDRVVGGGTPFFQDANPVPRMFSLASFNALGPAYLQLSQNPTLGDGGACYGDSGGPNFLDVGGTRVLVANTIAGDAACRATNKAIRLDTPTARAFLGQFVTLP